MTRVDGDSTGQERRLAVWLSVPAVCAATLVAVLEVYRALFPESELFVPPRPRTFVAALRDGGAESVFAFLKDGADPNKPVAFLDRSRTGSRTVRASPLLVAIAAGNEDAVRTLLGYGAQMALPQNSPAACLAAALGRPRLAALIGEHTRATPVPRCVVSSTPSMTPLEFYAHPAAAPVDGSLP